jgi:hypothetical protein
MILKTMHIVWAAKAYLQQPPWANACVAVPKSESQMKHTIETDRACAQSWQKREGEEEKIDELEKHGKATEWMEKWGATWLSKM